MANLAFDTYGKTRIRLMQVLNGEVLELNIAILLEGELADSYTTGDNSRVLPTDTMKNTVYVLARQHPIQSIEEFATVLGRHFLSRLPHITGVDILIEQAPWDRFDNGAFVQSSKEARTAKLNMSRYGESIRCGIRSLQILKTTNSAFFGYLKDEYTTLTETRDRLLGTILDADWNYSGNSEDQPKIRQTLLAAFSKHESLSVQHTLYAMGEAVLQKFETVEDIHLTMPNKHCLLVDLSRFGLDNPNQVFVPTDEPSGYIEARLTR